MRAVLLAAGLGSRLGLDRPKVLLEVGGRTLLERHLHCLAACGVAEAVIGVGHQGERIAAAVARLSPPLPVRLVANPDYRDGSITTVWALRREIAAGGPVLLMDADVLYDRRLLDRLLQAPQADCCLLDRELEAGEEPVKLCLRGGRPVELRKRPEPGVRYDLCGESVGFFRLSEAAARRLVEIAGGYLARGARHAPHEEAVRDLLRERPFGVAEVTGLPWIEIDFPEDAARAERQVLPRLVAVERPPVNRTRLGWGRGEGELLDDLQGPFIPEEE
ncbi:MAG: phosphocholine cytidylyltransferase family protein [Nitrospirae bacterium]|nr:MAG: phosphocholine cytidylyltransferase family protein [Nitrospirota bacterium]